jgi:hypothetical protein
MRCRARKSADGRHNRDGDVSATSNAQDCVSQEWWAGGDPLDCGWCGAASGLNQGNAGDGEYRSKADVVRHKRLGEVLVAALAVLLT